jgi:glucosamine--fructose-6-phosphate aminotransferase (isomerizing)
MCGIFGYVGPRTDAGNIVLEGLKTLEYRGYDSWGVAAKKADGSLVVEKHVGKIGNATLPEMSCSIAIGHTRWATHGGVTDANAHPHVSEDNSVVVVHNGIVENFESLKKELVGKGYHFGSETDTEVIVHLAAEIKKTESDLKQVALKTFHRLEGLNGIIFFFPQEEVILAIKNGSPLIFGKGENESFLASDISALLPHTRTVYFFEDGDLLEITRQGTAFFTIDGKPLEVTYKTLNMDPKQALLGEYPDFMTKEMHEQPQIIQELMSRNETEYQKFATAIQTADSTYFVGCGTAYYASLTGKYIMAKIANQLVSVGEGSEFGYHAKFFDEKTLLMPFSQSGETIDLINSVRLAKEKSARILSVINTYGSTLDRLSEASFLLNAGIEKCVLSTKAFSAKVGFLLMTAHTLAGTLDKGKKDLEIAVKEAQKLLSDEKTFVKLGKRLQDCQNIFVLGRGISFPTALESALKIKESSYIHAEGFAAGELKHGVIALIEKGTPVIVYNPEDETYEDTLSSAHEVKARGAFVIGISSKPNPVYDEYIEVVSCNEAVVIPNVVAAQLLAYNITKGKGLDPDKPRNLAKSVTVK